ncbi:MAG: pilus assembly protein [Lachnospiraceae bacterium]|nr:pilus assembly protein [Lachnospiraceae bacterium]
MGKKLKGSSTIEASLIMPMILTIFAFFIYLSFFLYNRVEVTTNAYILALRGSRMESETAKETYRYMKKESSKLMSGNLLAIKKYGEQMKVKGDNIQVTYSVSIQVPGAVILSNIFEENTWNYKITKKTKKLQPVLFIRNCRKISNLKNQSGKDTKNEGNL